MTKEKYRLLSQIFLTLGLLAWVPFIYLRVTGVEANLWPYLFGHLSGVIGYGQLRKRARSDEAGVEGPNRLNKIGRILILVGAVAMISYLVLEYGLKMDVEVGPFLIVHLPGVLGGSVMLIVSALRKKKLEEAIS